MNILERSEVVANLGRAEVLDSFENLGSLEHPVSFEILVKAGSPVTDIGEQGRVDPAHLVDCILTVVLDLVLIAVNSGFVLTLEVASALTLVYVASFLTVGIPAFGLYAEPPAFVVIAGVAAFDSNCGNPVILAVDGFVA